MSFFLDPTVDADRDESAGQRISRYLRFDAVHAPYLRWQVEQVERYIGRRILEIGCGVGGIVAQLGNKDLIVGIDVEPKCVDHVRERFGDRAECRFIQADFAQMPESQLQELHGDAFDTILCINTLEHVRDDIGALQRMEGVVMSGGHVALVLPAHLALYGAYDYLDGHFRRYTKAYLRVVLKQTGFRIVRMHYFNLIGGLGWFIHYKMLKRRSHDQSHFRAMNHLMSFARMFERWVKPPAGLSLIAVLKRP